MKFFLKNIIVLFLLAGNYTLSQHGVIDSLEVKLSSVEGEEKVDLFNKLSDLYQYIDTKKSIEFAEKGIELAGSIDYKKGLAGAYGGLGYSLIGKDLPKAVEYTQKALELRKEIDDREGVATSLNVLGVINYYAGDYLISIEHHLNSIKIKEAIGDKTQLATSYNNIALVYMAVENFDNALEYLNKALKIRTAANNKRGIGIIKTNLGEIYTKTGEYEKALKYFNESLSLNKKIGSVKAEANTYNSMASLYFVLNEYKKAFEYYNASLKIYEQLDIKNGIANAENGIANLYKIEEDYDSSIRHAEIALMNAEGVNALDNIYKATNTLYYCYQQKGNFKKAFEYLVINKTVQDSLKNDTKLKKIAKIELDYKIEKMKQEQAEELNRQKTFNQFLILILISGAIILVLIIWSSRNKKTANIKLYELNSMLNEVNSAKDRFLSIIAHDLRGPYQSTLGLSEVLAKEYDSLSGEEIKYSINNLFSSLNKQYELLDDLLKWANLQGGNFEFNTEKLSMKESVDDVFELLALTAGNKKIGLINNIENNLFVNADKNMLNLLLRNLISNSIKFTNIEGKVEITAFEKEGKIQTTVSDNGIGIEENILKNLFRIDVYYSKKGTSNEEGSGLGLILCKEIIEKHGGSIWVESEVNKGSKFIFTLAKS